MKHNKKSFVKSKNHATIIVFQDIDHKYLSDDLPFRKEILGECLKLKDEVMQSYSKYFDLGTHLGEVDSGPRGAKEDALFLWLTFKDKEKIMSDIFQSSKSKNLEIGEVVEFIKTVQKDLDNKMMDLESRIKEVTMKICDKFVDPKSPVILFDDRIYIKDMFSKQFVKKSIVQYTDFIEGEFETLRNKFSFDINKFERDYTYRDKWSIALGTNILYGDTLPLQKVSMKTIHENMVSSLGLHTY